MSVKVQRFSDSDTEICIASIKVWLHVVHREAVCTRCTVARCRKSTEARPDPHITSHHIFLPVSPPPPPPQPPPPPAPSVPSLPPSLRGTD